LKKFLAKSKNSQPVLSNISVIQEGLTSQKFVLLNLEIYQAGPLKCSLSSTVTVKTILVLKWWPKMLSAENNKVKMPKNAALGLTGQSW